VGTACQKQLGQPDGEGDPSWANEDPSRFLELKFVNRLESEKYADQIYRELEGRKAETRK